MKKYLVLLGAALLVMAVASPSMAQFKSWGHMEIATMWRNQNDFNIGGYDATTGAALNKDRDLNEKWITQRFRYYLQYGDPKTVRAVIGFEADSSNWGEPAWDNTGTTANPSGRMGTYGTDQVQLEIKHAFLEFVVPSTPLTVTAGMQWFGWGGRLWQSKDAPGVSLTANFAPHQIQAFWWREKDDARETYNVNDTYGVDWAMKQKAFNVGAMVAYKNDLSNAGYSDHPWWIGVQGGFRPGNFAFSGDFIYNGGKRDNVVGNDIDYKGWALDAMAEYKIGPGMSVALEGYYATGGDANKTDEYGEYTVPSGSEAWYGFGNDRSIFMFQNSDFMYTHAKYVNASGLWYGRVNFEYNPLAWINLNFNYLYIGDTRKNGNIVSYQSTARQDKDEDYVGSELNVIAKLQIYKSLYYNIAFGYFLPGKVYDAADKSADDAFIGVTCLRYFF
jgi:hypothetical protein